MKEYRYSKYKKLNEKLVEEIKSLEKECILYDGRSLKLELDYKLSSIKAEEITKQKSEDLITSEMSNEFCCYVEDKLVGYLGASDFGSSYIEVAGMVNPDYRRQKIYSRLLAMAREEWLIHRKENILLLVDANCDEGIGFITSLNVSLKHAEYEMYLRNKKLDIVDRHVELYSTTNEDKYEIASQNRIYFGEEQDSYEVLEDKCKSLESIVESLDTELILPEEEALKGMYIFIAKVGVDIIGKIHIQMSDTLAGIYGLGVKPKYRSQGYGREILQLGIEKGINLGAKDIMLQVEVSNSNALKLYTSCGFEQVSCMNYYKYIWNT